MGFLIAQNGNSDNIDTISNSITSISGDLSITNSTISDLNSFIYITSVGGYIDISNNTNLTNISGLSNIAGIDGKKLIIDTTYTTKADNNQSFCKTNWDIYEGSSNISDDMSVVCY